MDRNFAVSFRVCQPCHQGRVLKAAETEDGPELVPISQAGSLDGSSEEAFGPLVSDELDAVIEAELPVYGLTVQG